MTKPYNNFYFSSKGLGFFLSLFLFIPFSLFSSNEFVGVLTTKDGISMTYTINFNIDSNQTIIGYSISNAGKIDETKTMFNGKLVNNKIDLVEYKVISTKAKMKDNDICYIHLNGKIKSIINADIIVGNFEGFLPNNKKCAVGKVYLLSKQKAYEVLNTFQQKLKKDSTDKNVKKIDSQIKETKEKLVEILAMNSNNSITTLNWGSDTVFMRLWDQDKVDNDKLRLFVNDVLYKNEVKLAVDYKYISKFIFIDKRLKIELVAINEGFFPPNTSKIQFIDGDKNYLYQNNLKTKESCTYIFNKVP